MTVAAQIRFGLLLAATVTLGACGGVNFADDPNTLDLTDAQRRQLEGTSAGPDARASIFDLFLNVDDPNVTVEVNKYIWVAAQDVLNFMPVEAVDPFSGVISYGYGVPPGGRQAYRATVLIKDPALDARSLNVAMQSRSGPVSADTVRAIEDAILTRARQLRLNDAKL